jgi:hypothetical protein
VIALAPVLAVLLTSPVCFGERQDPERLELIATAIATVSSTRDDAVGLLTIGEAESAWCLAVHSGRRKGWSGVGLWQLEPGSHRHPPFAGLSLADTTHAAGEALWLWRHSYDCGHSIEGRMRVYGGRSCSEPWPGAAKRARLFAWISWRLGALT